MALFIKMLFWNTSTSIIRAHLTNRASWTNRDKVWGKKDKKQKENSYKRIHFFTAVAVIAA